MVGRVRLHATHRRHRHANRTASEAFGLFPRPGPSPGLGKGAIEAVDALEPFEVIVDELLQSLPGAALA